MVRDFQGCWYCGCVVGGVVDDGGESGFDKPDMTDINTI